MLLEPGSSVPANLVPTIQALKPALIRLLATRLSAAEEGPVSLSLPQGWEEAVDAWIKAGCPNGDSIMVGLKLAALNQLARLPREERPPALREWRRQLEERRRLAEEPK